MDNETPKPESAVSPLIDENKPYDWRKARAHLLIKADIDHRLRSDIFYDPWKSMGKKRFD